MKTIVYEGGFEGFLTVIHDAYIQKSWPEAICRAGCEGEEGLFEERSFLVPERAKATKVATAFRAKAGAQTFQTLLYAWLHDSPALDSELAVFVRKLFKNPALIGDLADPVIHRVNAAAQFTGRELHRWEGFTRFSRLKEGGLYAVLEPKSDILALLGNHFKNRMAGEQWILHDTRRKQALLYDGQQSHLLSVAHADAAVLHQEEALYRELWRCFFDTTATKERISRKRQLRWVAKRFHPFMTEMGP